MRSRVVVTLLTIALAACGGSHPPTAPTPPAGGNTSVPSVKFELKADDAGSRDPIAALSEVIVDASGSTGAGALTFAIDFGDGATASTSVARHVYATAGTYTVTCRIADAQGGKASDARQITVKDLTGQWFQAAYGQRAQRIQVRHLNIIGQDPPHVRGTYQVSGEADRAFTATLSRPRAIRIAVDGGPVLEGVVPSQVNDAGAAWALQSSDGEPLEFHAIVGDPSPTPPDAEMHIAFGDDPNAWGPIAGLTPVRIDASPSRGAGLIYFIDFGDGFVATGSQATRAGTVGVHRKSPSREAMGFCK